MKIILTISAAVVALAAFGASAASAGTVLYNTGYYAGGSEIALGTIAADGNWAITGGTGTGISGSTAYASATNGQFPIGPWVADDTTSRWITPTMNAADSFDPSGNGTYQFTQTFNLTSANFKFLGQFADDNRVDSITLNGASIYSASLGPSDYGSWTSFAAATGFKTGVNTLTFDVVNYGQNGGNPAGLDVQFLSQGVPEPATWAMFLIGFAGLGAAMRLNRRQTRSAVAMA